MSIVSLAAPQANKQRTDLSTACYRASDTAADIAGEPHAQSLRGIGSPLDAREYIPGYEHLSKLGVKFYPVRGDKSPAVEGSLNREATADLMKLRFWAEHRHHRSFALRILSDSRLMVVDTESPFKHAEEPGPDGEIFLYSLLEDNNITLPPCPMAQTAAGGFHRYLLTPKWLPVRSAISLWPGIDILAAGSNVILPGSRTELGRYQALRSFEECPIPEAPKAFARLIRRAQEVAPRYDRSLSNRSCTAPVGDSSVSQQQWWLLFRNQVFRSFWNRKGKVGDKSDSAYEYHLVKACFCCGLNRMQAEHVILAWRHKHKLKRSLRQLRGGIVAAAWREVEPWVKSWHAERAAIEESKTASKTSNTILAFIGDTVTPQTPSTIASALAIPRERAKKAMQRMAADGKLQRTQGGYAVGDTLGTF